MVKRGEGRVSSATKLRNRLLLSVPPTAASRQLQQVVFVARYFLRGSDTVPFGLRTAVPVVTYLPEEAERCGPLGVDLPAIPISYT